MTPGRQRATLVDIFAAARDPELSAKELRLWLLYRSYQQRDGRGAYPGDDLLASQMGCSQRSVQRHRRALIEKGYLVQKRRGPKPAHHWAVIPDEETTAVAKQGPERDDSSGESTEESPKDSPKETTAVSPEYGENGENTQPRARSSAQEAREDSPSVSSLSSPNAVEGGEEEAESDGDGWPSPSEAAADGYPEAFEETWTAYPTRDGGNPKKGAYRKWLARVRNGAGPGELLKATRAYASRCDADDRTGTRYVKQAITFFGPDDHWREELQDGDGDVSPRTDLDRQRAALDALDGGGRRRE